jgi:hypothetical protein
MGPTVEERWQMKPTAPDDRLPIDSLATLNDDSSLLMLGIIPAVVIIVVALIFLGIYLYRRGKSWNELGEAMRLDDGDKPIANTDFDPSFNSQNISRLDPTVPAKRLDGDRSTRD